EPDTTTITPPTIPTIEPDTTTISTTPGDPILTPPTHPTFTPGPSESSTPATPILTPPTHPTLPPAVPVAFGVTIPVPPNNVQYACLSVQRIEANNRAVTTKGCAQLMSSVQQTCTYATNGGHSSCAVCLGSLCNAYN
uniref:Uncharacterized protein n=1 Tax=Anopheles dirus TaxID=7168 RepID=A0A182NX14_9DIPT